MSDQDMKDKINIFLDGIKISKNKRGRAMYDLLNLLSLACIEGRKSERKSQKTLAKIKILEDKLFKKRRRRKSV